MKPLRAGIIAALLAAAACSDPPRPRVHSEWIGYPRPLAAAHDAVLRAMRSIGYAIVRDEAGASGFVVEACFEKPEWRIRQRVEGRADGDACALRYATRTSEEADIVHGGWHIYRGRLEYETPEYDDAPCARAANAHEILKGTIECEMERMPETSDAPR